MSAEDQREWDRWIKANAIVGSIFAVGLLAMAFLGSIPTGHGGLATTGNATSVAASR
jgi:hypothetical protein